MKEGDVYFDPASGTTILILERNSDSENGLARFTMPCDMAGNLTEIDENSRKGSGFFIGEGPDNKLEELLKNFEKDTREDILEHSKCIFELLRRSDNA